MANVLEKEWHSYFVQPNETEKKSVLQMLKTSLKSCKENAERVSIDQHNKEIAEAMRQVKKGEVHTHEEVVKWQRTGNVKRKSDLD